MVEDIKEKLIDKLKSIYHDYVYFDITDVKRIINEMPDSAFTPKLVDRDINADKNKLFDKNVSDVIDYLSSYKDYKLRQRWSRYESNYFVFNTKEKETEEEMFNRLYDIVNNKYSRLLDKKSEIASLNLKKKELLDKIAELDKRIESL